jgi:hypothetical protein
MPRHSRSGYPWVDNEALLEAMEGKVAAQGEIVGVYQR